MRLSNPREHARDKGDNPRKHTDKPVDDICYYTDCCCDDTDGYIRKRDNCCDNNTAKNLCDHHANADDRVERLTVLCKCCTHLIERLHKRCSDCRKFRCKRIR